ncbi:MAG: FAD-dependent oxidoreductase [Betaproteobacteria bacterium]|nr:FAD-dependent oxidoreductase [Betaproteobacteria bacterium]
MERIVIIGSGLAGYNVAKELRKLDKSAALAIITADGGEFYSKPMLSNALGTGKTPQTLPLNSATQMAEQLAAEVRVRTRVTAIEPEHHRVRLGDETLEYSKLVLAIGAAQIRLPLEGGAAGEVLSVNSLDDYARFRTTLDGKKRIAIIGAGLIGCEFANDLATSGREVEVIDIAGQPLPRLLPPEGGELLRDRLAALGVTWHLGTSASGIERSGAGLRVALADGIAIDAEIVLSAVGLKPKLELAQAAGIEVNRGIRVNRFLETSAPDVHALGDCAEVEGLVLPFVMPIMHAARALAATLAGTRTALSYPAMPVLVKTPACPTIVSPPANDAAGEWKIEKSEDGVKALFVDATGKLLGFSLNGKATAERAKLAQQVPPVLA